MDKFDWLVAAVGVVSGGVFLLIIATDLVTEYWENKNE